MALPDNEAAVVAWLAEIEESCGVSPLFGDSSICETGDDYVEIVCNRSGNLVFDGTAKRENTQELAWSKWVEAFLLYQKPRGGKIHWRHKPEMTYVEKQAEGYPVHDIGYCVYSRLFVEKLH